MPVIDLNNDLSDIKHVSNCWDKSIVPLSQIQLDTKEFLSPKPHCLAGRATAVVPAESIENGKSTEMVCKIYNPELQQRHEGLMMQVIYRIVEQNPLPGKYQSMLDHLPKFYFFGEVPRSTTNRIRSMVNRRWKGHRVLRIIGMKRLHKLTTVSGWPFVKAWLDGVTCSLYLLD
jgi:ribosomal protein L30/L7E